MTVRICVGITYEMFSIYWSHGIDFVGCDGIYFIPFNLASVPAINPHQVVISWGSLGIRIQAFYGGIRGNFRNIPWFAWKHTYHGKFEIWKGSKGVITKQRVSSCISPAVDKSQRRCDIAAEMSLAGWLTEGLPLLNNHEEPRWMIIVPSGKLT